MLIRSQNKEQLINYEQSVYVTINTTADNKYELYLSTGVVGVVLGAYDTYEKSLKVLDKIQDYYEEIKDAEYYRGHTGYSFAYNTFEMPLNDEVLPPVIKEDTVVDTNKDILNEEPQQVNDEISNNVDVIKESDE